MVTRVTLPPGLLEAPWRRPALKVTLACLLVLLAGQALIGALSLSALNRLVAETTADRVEVVAGRLSATLENGMRLGKPLAQYFGLDVLLQDSKGELNGLQGIAVVLANGRQVAAQGALPAETGALLRAVRHPSRALAEDISHRSSGAVLRDAGRRIVLAMPVSNVHGQVVGAVVLTVSKGARSAWPLVIDNLKVLFAVTLLAGLGLAVVFKYVVPERALAAGRARWLVPLMALLLAQGVYAAYTISTFRAAALQVARDHVTLAATGLQADFGRVLGYGLALDSLRGVEAPFARLARAFPVIDSIELVDPAGKVLGRANAEGALPVAGLPVHRPTADDLTLVLPLGSDRVAGQLVLHLANHVIIAGVRGRVMDALTVVAVSLVVVIEMLLLLSLLLDRAFASLGMSAQGVPTEDDVSEVGRVARPVIFGMLFAWALPLGFLPLYARSLPAGGLNIGTDLLVALPISVEMGCGLLGVLLAGWLTDRRGWQMPALVGLFILSAGMAACAVAASILSLTAARGLVGLGYGLTWMSLQGFIVMRSPALSRGRNMARLVAGLFAGHLSGAAVGAMLMQQLGFRVVFVIGALMIALPLVGTLVLMRPYMTGRARDEAPASLPASESVPVHAAVPAQAVQLSTIRLLFSRDFGLLLAGSVIPFSVAQVGLLSFALPLYLEAEGAAAGSIGRVLMIYGVCVIYLGPLMGRFVDRSSAKKPWIVLGGLIGSLGMLSLYFHSGLLAAATAVLALALASCCAGTSYSPYMLALPHVQRYGVARATSVMRAADKAGQMVGPLVMGAMFSVAGMAAGLAATGAIYLLATLAFLWFAPGQPRNVFPVVQPPVTAPCPPLPVRERSDRS